MSDSDRPPAALAVLALQLVVELATFAALVYWGWRTGGGLAGVTLGLGAAMAVSVLWAVFGSPAAPRRLSEPARLGLRLAIFAATTAALVAAGRAAFGVAFAAVALGTTALVHRWNL